MKIRSVPVLALLWPLLGCPAPDSSDPLADLLTPETDLLAPPPDLTGPEPDPLQGIGAVDKVMAGMAFQFTEGPLWLAARGVLLFTDVQASMIYELTPPSAVRSIRMGVRTNGLALDPQARVVVCEPGAAPPRVSRMEGAMYTGLADMTPGGQNLNGPNDVIVRADGTIYFTDPSGTMTTPQGVYRIDPQGRVHAVDTTLFFPNGVALSPDQRTLYVAEGRRDQVHRYPVNPDGSVGQRGLFASTAGGGTGSGGGDGMAIDDRGNVYVTTNIIEQGVKVYRPDGTIRGNIRVPEVPSNVSFGGADRKTLYITARTSVYRVTLGVPWTPLIGQVATLGRDVRT